MQTDEIDTLDECDEVCDDCGRLCESTDGGMCEACAAAHDTAREEAQAEADAARDELETLETELEDLKARIREAKRRVRTADRELGRLY